VIPLNAYECWPRAVVTVGEYFARDGEYLIVGGKNPTSFSADIRGKSVRYGTGPVHPNNRRTQDVIDASTRKRDGLPALGAFRTVRDKLTAHTEIRFVADKYQPVDIGALGVKWGDLKTCIVKMQHCVELIGFIVRNAGFAWDMLDRQLSEAAHGFWSSPEAAS
jgi:hypothetical protein